MYTQLLFLGLVAAASAFSLRDTLRGITNAIRVTTQLASSFGLEDAYLSIEQLAEKYSYPIETHSVVTEDGYVLLMHRISKVSNVTNIKKVVLLMPGMLDHSENWLLLGPDKSLGYLLADRGYDVWMGNTRGSKYSREHQTLNSKMAQFWSYTWEEIGVYDLPAMIDYILESTGQEGLYFIGLSQGTTIFFVMNSMRPEYNKKIVKMFALAPQVFMGTVKQIPLKMLSLAKPYYRSLHSNHITLSTGYWIRFTPLLCIFLPVNCDKIYEFAVGPHNINQSTWPIILEHTITDIASLQVLHYGQLAYSKRFTRYDFGKDENMQKYGQPTPPDYNLKLVTSPVVLFYCGNDWFSDRRDIELLKNELPQVVGEYYVEHFTHLDFMYSDEAATIVYPNIFKEIEKK